MLGDVPPAHRRLVSWVFVATAILLPPVALMAPLGVAPLLTLATVALLVIAPRQVLDGARRLWPLVALWAALACWAVASAAWSILPRHSLFEGLRFLVIGVEGITILGAAMSLSPQEGRDLRRAALTGTLLALVLAAIELATDGALTRLIHGFGPGYLNFARFDRGMTTLVLVFWPALLGFGSRRLWQVGFSIAVAAIVWFMPSSAAALALVVAAVAYFVARSHPRLVAGALAASLVGVAVILTLALPSEHSVLALHQKVPWVKTSGLHRILIWRFTVDRIAERPLLGWGMDASRVLPGGKTDLSVALPGIGLTPGSDALPLHPHNAALQWEVELGAPGAALALAIVLWGLWRIGWRDDWGERRACALGWAAAALVIGLLSYGIWQPWWLSSLLLTAGLLAGSAADDG